MRPFSYERVTDTDAAIAAATALRAPAMPDGASQFLAGGTTLIDLMKLDVMRPRKLVDINALAAGELGGIEGDEKALRLGALVRMADAAEHPLVRRDYPLIAQSLELAASQQLRNMASLGGNVLQRTRCSYFRDVSYAACNKRHPGSGCAAIEGFNRSHAVLGISDRCIATYPGDFAVALIALDTTVVIEGPEGARAIPFAELHRPPGEFPHIETSLMPGEIVAAFLVRAAPWTRRSLFLKVRDRESYEFALASAAVALDLDRGKVREARIGLGGVATVPWRAHDAEDGLKGRALDESSAAAAAEAAFAKAVAREHNTFKIELGKRTLVRALLQAAAMEVAS